MASGPEFITVRGVLLDFGQDPANQIRNAAVQVKFDSFTKGIDPAHPRTTAAILSLLNTVSAFQIQSAGCPSPSKLENFVMPISTLALGHVLVFHCADSALAYNLYAARSCCSLDSGDSALIRGPALLLYADARPFLGSLWVELDHCIAEGVLPIFQKADDPLDAAAGGKSAGGHLSDEDEDGSDDDDVEHDDDEEDEHEQGQDELDSGLGLRRRNVDGGGHMSAAERRRMLGLQPQRSARLAEVKQHLERRLYFIEGPEAPELL